MAADRRAWLASQAQMIGSVWLPPQRQAVPSAWSGRRGHPAAAASGEGNRDRADRRRGPRRESLPIHGVRIGSSSIDREFAVANLMQRPDVPQAALAAYLTSAASTLSGCLLDGLAAADGLGGDVRGGEMLVKRRSTDARRAVRSGWRSRCGRSLVKSAELGRRCSRPRSAPPSPPAGGGRVHSRGRRGREGST